VLDVESGDQLRALAVAGGADAEAAQTAGSYFDRLVEDRSTTPWFPVHRVGQGDADGPRLHLKLRLQAGGHRISMVSKVGAGHRLVAGRSR
jgi:hypothetical protein